MYNVIIAIAILIFIRLLVYYLMLLLCTMGETVHAVFLTYKNFKAIYSIAPKKYRNYHFEDHGPCIIYRDYKVTDGYKLLYFKSIIDWWKAELLLYKRDKIINDKRRRDTKANFIEAVKKDLELFGGKKVVPLNKLNKEKENANGT